MHGIEYFPPRDTHSTAGTIGLLKTPLVKIPFSPKTGFARVDKSFGDCETATYIDIEPTLPLLVDYINLAFLVKKKQPEFFASFYNYIMIS